MVSHSNFLVGFNIQHTGEIHQHLSGMEGLGQQTQVQQALRQQVIALTGAMQQLTKTQSEETRRNTSRG